MPLPWIKWPACPPSVGGRQCGHLIREGANLNDAYKLTINVSSYSQEYRQYPVGKVVSTVGSGILFACFSTVEHVPTIDSFLCEVINS